jgi:hypothetical protein
VFDGAAECDKEHGEAKLSWRESDVRAHRHYETTLRGITL